MAPEGPQTPSVLFLTPATELGGEELSTLSIARELVADGGVVGLATTGGSLLHEFDRTGVRIHIMPMNERRPRGIWRASRELRLLLEGDTYQIVHSQEVFPTLIAHLARTTPRRQRVGLIYHYRGVRPAFMPFVARVIPRCADLVLTNAEANRRAFLERGTRPELVRTVYNGFDFSPFEEPHDGAAVRRDWGIDPEAPVAAVVGRLHRVKGHRHFLEAAQRVAERLTAARFVIVGDGPLRDDLSETAARLKIAERVTFLGFQRDIPRILSAVNLVVLPSTEEAIGRVLVEAHAAGVPAVASRVGGTGEVIEDDVSGYLVPPGDADALAEKMVEILSSPERGREMGSAGRARVRRLFGVDTMMTRIHDAYRDVASAASSRTVDSGP